MPTHLASIYCGISIFLLGCLALITPSGYSISALLLLVGGLYALTQPKVRLNSADKWLLITLALFTLEGIFNGLWHQLSSQNYDKVIRFILAIPIFFYIRWAKPSVSWVWGGLGIGGTLIGFQALYERMAHGVERVSGYTHAIQFGNLSMLTAFFCLAGLGWSLSRQFKKRATFTWLLILGAIGGILGSLLSGSRGGWVGLPLVLLVLYRAYHPFFTLRLKLSLGILVIITGLVVFSIPQLNVQPRIQRAFEDIALYQKGNSNTSLGARFEMWQGAIQLIQAKPMLGWGKDHYQNGMVELAEQGYANPVVKTFNHAHNEFIDRTAKHGVVGLIILLLLYGVPLWYFNPYLKNPDLSIRALAVSGTILPVAYIDFGLSQTFLSHNSGVMMYALWLVIWAACLRNTIEASTSPAATEP